MNDRVPPPLPIGTESLVLRNLVSCYDNPGNPEAGPFVLGVQTFGDLAKFNPLLHALASGGDCLFHFGAPYES